MNKNLFITLFLILISTFHNYPQNFSLEKLDSKYIMYFDQGNYLQAQEYLYLILSKKDSLSIESLGRYFNELGILKKIIGRYDSSELYFEKYLHIAEENSNYIHIIYALNNLAILYKNQGNYYKAIEYYKKSFSLLNSNEYDFPKSDYCYYMLYYNLAIVYFYLKNYSKSLFCLEQSHYYHQNANLNKERKINYYKARCFDHMNDTLKAYEYYKKCIRQEIEYNGDNHIKVGLKNLEFGKFLSNFSFKEDAIAYYRKGLSIYQNFYPSKHPEFSNTYLLLSKYFLKKQQIDSSKYYNQKALSSVILNFDESDFYKNPHVVEALSKLGYLNALKAKAELLQLIAGKATDTKEKRKNLDFGLETLDLAIDVFNNIRQGYLTEENKLFITENGKELFSLAIDCCTRLFELTYDNDYKHKALAYSSACKSSLLRTSMKLYDYLYSEQGTDSTRKKLISTQQEIAAYQQLINGEKTKKGPNDQLLSQYQEKLFALKRMEEEILLALQGNVNNKANDPPGISLLQKQLADGQSIIEYHLSAPVGGKPRAMHTFVITQTDINIVSQDIDTSLAHSIERVKQWMEGSQHGEHSTGNKQQFLDDLRYLYRALIQPAEQYIAGDKLVIIPDDELSGISFDILLAGEIGSGSVNFSTLPYLLKDYSISYALSLPFIFPNKKYNPDRAFVSAFAPEYTSGPLATVRKDFGMLKNLEHELQGILECFDGKSYTKTGASEQAFRLLAGRQHIFHFAMHADCDSANHKFSYLAFQPDKGGAGGDDGYLYSYEIGLMQLNSPMVVLSACNTGVGKQVAGEGTLSLARSFFMAGAQSVVHTLWPVDDKVSAGIMRSFYKYLAKGCDKATAMQKAKLGYLSSADFQSETDPVYWAGFVVSGDGAALVEKGYSWVYVLSSIATVLLFIIIQKNKILYKFLNVKFL